MIENTNTKQFYPGPILNDTLEINEFLFNTAEQIKIKHSKLDENGVLRDVDLEYGYDYEVVKDEALTCEDDETPSHTHLAEMALTASTGQIILKEHVTVLAGERLTAYRESAIIQDKNYPRTGAFPAAAHEGALDYLTMQNQEQQDELDRALKVPVSTQNFAGSMPLPVPGRALKINQDGSGFEMSEFDPDMAKIETDEARNQAKAAAEGAAKSEAEAIKQATDAKNAAKSVNDNIQSALDKSDSLLNMSRILPMFTPIWSDHTLNDASFLRADTFSWHSGKIFTAGYDTLVAEYNSTECVTETEAGVTYKRTPSGFKIADLGQHENVLNAFTSTGKSWFYVLDTAQQRFKLPRTKYSFTGIRDSVGRGVDAGLPTLTAQSNGAHTHTANSAGGHKHDIGFDNYDGSRYGTKTLSGNYKQSGWGQAAVNANSAYTSTDGAHTHTTTSNGAHTHTIPGTADTVQPPATQMYLYFFVGNYVRPNTDINIGKFVEYINEIDFVGETENAKQEINTTKVNSLAEINTTKTNSLNEITTTKTNSVKDINTLTTKCLTDINNTGIDGKVSKLGDTMTGNLVISKTMPYLTLSTPEASVTGAIASSKGISYLVYTDAEGHWFGQVGIEKYAARHNVMKLQAHITTDAGADNAPAVRVYAFPDGKQGCSFPMCTTKATTTSSARTDWVATVVQNYVSGKSWYRVWSDGWIEQGGGFTTSSSWTMTTITFLKAFSNTNYMVTSICGHNANTDSPCINAKTNKNFSTYIYNGTGNGSWYACGY